MDNWRVGLTLTIFGVIVGFSVGIPDEWTQALNDWKPWGHVAIGAAIGAVIIPALRVAEPVLERFQIETIKLPFPKEGEVTMRLTGGQKRAAWRIFVDLSTRITAWSIQEKANGKEPHYVGALRPAFDSFYSVFTMVRDELKSMPPSVSIPDGQRTFESYILQLLNKGVRPFLARWHPKFDAWEKTGKPDEDWPLNKLCREDLEIMRENCLVYIWALGTALKVKRLEELLPPSEAYRHNKDLRLWKPKDLSSIQNIIEEEAKAKETARREQTDAPAEPDQTQS